jgi:RHS repeat-associated protein
MSVERSATDPYGSSNAPNYSPPVGYQVNPRTGTLQVSIKPPPLFGFLGDAATPAIQYSQNASFLNRQVLHLPLGWLYSYSFILDSKVHVNGEASFYIDSGYASGMRYYTLEDVVFEDFGDPRPFPYDRSRSFTSMLRFTTGNRQYLDAFGRLIGMDDRFGNHVIFEYAGSGDVIASRISRIIDSLGRATVFNYASDRITISYPRGGNNAIEFSYLLDEQSYLVGYVDPLGGRTTIESKGGLARHDLVSRVAYPNGLEVSYDYGALRFYLPGKGQFHRLDCVVGINAVSAGVTRAVTYNYDPDDTAHNFTGYPTFYVDGETDHLLESGSEYRYRVQVDDGVLITEHVYNRLHLELETRTMTRDSRKLINHAVRTYPGETPDGSFPLYVDLRRDFPNYQSPDRVLSETYDDDGQKRQHIVETDFDLHGQPKEARAYRSDSQPSPDNLLWKQVTTYDYPTDSDPGHYGIVLVDERWDYSRVPSVAAAAVVRRTVNSLTQDRKSIAESATAFVAGGPFAPDQTQRFEYDACGRVTLEELAWTDGKEHSPQRTQRWTIYQDQVLTVTTAIKNVLNQATTTVSDSTTGWTISVTDAVGASVTYTYDSAGRRLTQTDPLGVVTRWSYDDAAGKVTTRFANGYETYTYFDGFGDEVGTADNGLPAGGERTLSKKSYNALGQLAWEQGVLGEASRLRYEYDDHGRLAKTTDALGNITSYTYNAAAQTQTTSFNGYKIRDTTSLDEASTVYTYSTRDADDRVESTSITNSFDLTLRGRFSATQSGAWVETSYEYDAALDLRSYASQGADGITGRHEIERDLFGNVRQETVEIDIRGGTPHTAKGDLAQYNELNQLVADRNPIGQTSPYTYDAAGRQETFTDYSGTVFRSRYLPNNQVDTVSYQEDAEKPIEKRFRYDHLTHDLTSIEEVVGGHSVGAVDRSYKLDGSLESVTYPDGRKVTITYDDQYARISGLTDALGITTHYGYDGWGRLQSAEIAGLSQRVELDYYDRSEDAANSGRLKSTTTNGSLCRTYLYNGFGSVATITYTDVRVGTPKELLSVELSYTPAQNVAVVVCRSALMPSHPALNCRKEYTYNSLNQLTRTKVTQLSDGAIKTIDFEYDAANNVTREVQTDASGSSSTTTYTYDADNKLLQVDGPGGIAKLAYDTNGNLVADGFGATYGYDKKGKLVRYSNEKPDANYTYTYYANELRATKQIAGGDSIRYYYDGSTVPTITNEAQSDAGVSYLLAGSERLLRSVRMSGQPTAQYLITSAKDMTAALDANLALESAYNYAPYGAQAQGGDVPFGVKANPFQYSRQYTDAESELIYLRSRYYHPGLKRFLTRDTATLLNRYNYGDGNPINGVDPTGEVFGVDDFLIGLAISAVIGAAVGSVIGGATTKSWKGAGFGALAGFVGGATAFATGTAITGAIAGVGALAGFAVEEAGAAVGFLVGAGTGALSGAAGGAAGQAAANLAGDNGDVGQAALWGAAFGFVVGGVTGARATFRYRNSARFAEDIEAPPGNSTRAQMLNAASPRMLNNLSGAAWRRVGGVVRGGGGKHEWLAVEHFARWRAMGYTVEDIRSSALRTSTDALEFNDDAGSWVLHNDSGGHPYYNNTVGEARGVLSLHRAVRGFSNRVRVTNNAGVTVQGVNALPDGFRGFLPPLSRLIRMPFSIAYGVQGRVWF